LHRDPAQPTLHDVLVKAIFDQQDNQKLRFGAVLNESARREGFMKAEPKVTRAQLRSWCPEPRGNQPLGYHHEIPAMEHENASSEGKDEENRMLHRRLAAVVGEVKGRDSDDPETGPRFVLQWRIFPNASNPKSNDAGQCGCSCGCT
jgi:hypothetical protein